MADTLNEWASIDSSAKQHKELGGGILWTTDDDGILVDASQVFDNTKKRKVADLGFKNYTESSVKIKTITQADIDADKEKDDSDKTKKGLLNADLGLWDIIVTEPETFDVITGTTNIQDLVNEKNAKIDDEDEKITVEELEETAVPSISYIKTKLNSVYKYKGSVTLSELVAKKIDGSADAEENGSVYNINSLSVVTLPADSETTAANVTITPNTANPSVGVAKVVKEGIVYEYDVEITEVPGDTEEDPSTYTYVYNTDSVRISNDTGSTKATDLGLAGETIYVGDNIALASSTTGTGDSTTTTYFWDNLHGVFNASGSMNAASWSVDKSNFTF